MRTTLNTLGWALFLAVSWTWCIGMYLPTLLVRDGGIPFFLAFLIPNVLGAASVGWLLASRGASAGFIARLRPVLIAFTVVTVAFHGYFLAWQGGLSVTGGDPELLVGLVVGASLVLNAVAARGRADWVGALVALFFSLACGALLTGFPPDAVPDQFGVGLLGLAAVTTLGFGLCPYLDLSFNQACQQADRPRAAFTVGFFVVFLATILIATRGRVVWTPPEPLVVGGAASWLPMAIGCHFGGQAAFTVAAHASAARGVAPSGVIAAQASGGVALRWAVVLPLVVGVLVGVLAFWLPEEIGVGGDSPMARHELGYRFFLAAYGLLFPAWLLLCWGGRGPLDRGTLAWLAATCALAMPFYWLGMVALDHGWLIPGVALVLSIAGVRRLVRPKIASGDEG